MRLIPFKDRETLFYFEIFNLPSKFILIFLINVKNSKLNNNNLIKENITNCQNLTLNVKLKEKIIMLNQYWLEKLKLTSNFKRK